MSEQRHHMLQADCESCFGLCCVALPFAASVDFARDKEAGQPCPHLRTDFRCGVHRELRQIGYKGCTVYDCFGAGQKVSQVTFSGHDWRLHPETAKPMFEVFPIMRHLHEILWYLTEASSYSAAEPIHHELQQAIQETEHWTNQTPEAIREVDIADHRAKVKEWLHRTSELVRREALQRYGISTKHRKSNRGGADLMGAKLQGADLRCADLRGAYLIAADLRHTDLRHADLIGAYLRDADLRGANLENSLFLTPFQVNAAGGDASTKLPPSLARPPHWELTS